MARALLDAPARSQVLALFSAGVRRLRLSRFGLVVAGEGAPQPRRDCISAAAALLTGAEAVESAAAGWLAVALHDPVPRPKAAAAEALVAHGRSHRGSVDRELATLARSPSAPATWRIDALWALDGDGWPALSTAIALITDGDPGVEAAAVERLGRLGAREAEAELAARLFHPHPDVAAAAADGLGRLSVRARVPALVARLAEGPAVVRAAAAAALGRIGGSEATKALAEAQKDPDPKVRRAAAEGLGDGEAPPGAVSLAGSSGDLGFPLHPGGEPAPRPQSPLAYPKK